MVYDIALRTLVGFYSIFPWFSRRKLAGQLSSAEAAEAERRLPLTAGLAAVKTWLLQRFVSHNPNVWQ